jgi:hypothetical protein
MSLWVLDTDMLTLWLRGQETVAARVATTPPQQLAVTIITIEEVLGGGTLKSGRHAMINSLPGRMRRSNKPSSLPEAFSSYHSTYRGFAAIANCGRTIVALGRMISASLRLSSNSRGFW